MERGLFRFILRHSLKGQVVVVLATLAAFPFYYASLAMPEAIVNQALDADPQAFPRPMAIFGWSPGHFSQVQWLVICASCSSRPYRSGPGAVIEPGDYPRLSQAIVSARRRLREKITAPGLQFCIGAGG